jgi:hypothetical protein
MRIGLGDTLAVISSQLLGREACLRLSIAWFFWCNQEGK